MSIETFGDVRGWFHERLTASLDKRGVDATDEAQLYLLELLSRGGLGRAAPTRPLALLLAEASEASGHEQLRRFRTLGDEALYLGGFFADHLDHRGITPEYVSRLGGGAYLTASELAKKSAQEAVHVSVFHELAEKFVSFTEVLDDVRESTSLRTPQDIVRLYDRWRRTGSPRVAERLTAEGVYPTLGRGGPTLH